LLAQLMVEDQEAYAALTARLPPIEGLPADDLHWAGA